ncbi:MAG TPA: excinuclease ABC subunit UvrC [Gaiellaceae bacterium]|jgi:excinuclease ABC subunit C|nr:excinuclease ABC subunit UvrC [Gaiellaceae bacterium]
MATDRIESQLKRLSTGPGVYILRDAKGDVLYVGKAKSLRPRVRSYFQAGSSDTRQGIRHMAARVETIETIVTSSEVEALHLEQNLVKRHRPPFNVRLRDDKSFPYIAVTVEDDYPRVMFTRERHRRGVVYFGPYANAKTVRETLDVLNRVFRYRPCEGPQPGRHSGIPCLDFHIERCHAPCVGYISKEDYRELIDQVIEFLSGDDRPIRRRLEEQMREAAADERFEDAARYRNRLRAIERLSERQAVERKSIGTIDVIGVAVSEERAAVQVFPLREGRMVDRYSFHLENAAGEPIVEVLEQFCLEYYGSARSIPPQILVPRGAGDLTALETFLSERRGSHVEVRAPERGEKRRLQELAQQNAQLALDSQTFVTETKRARRLESLEELREALNLESLPIRIECFDISNIQGQEIVGSMVVFEDAVAKKAHYRKFTVKGVEGQDDFASMREVISRRFSRLSADPGSDEWNESFAAMPNLVVIDGGKGQLSAALAAMQELDLPRVAVISLAKRIEEVFVPGRSDPILLDERSPGLQLLQRIRDEAHRFAVTFHRQRRDAAARESVFDQITGVGPSRRRALLRHFGSAERVLNATEEELEGVPGLPAKTARSIYSQLRRTGRA